MKQHSILISACLLGINCDYKGGSKPCEKLIEKFKRGELVPVCPEQLGGMTTPRIPSEIIKGGGLAVIQKQTQVINKKGSDVSKEFIQGAKEVLKIARLVNAKQFIGRAKSPSCGVGETYDGSFTGKLVKGDGVTAALLKQNNINSISSQSFG